MTADLWAAGRYELVADAFAPVHDAVTEALAAQPGERVLDLACGTGALALRAARRGAVVGGLDRSPAQVEKARRAAAAAGLEIDFREGDCAELPYEDASFDAVGSTFGLIFAEDHERAAAELARVCRPGGRAALTAWTEDAWTRVGERVGRPQDVAARRWGDPDYVEERLGSAFDLSCSWGECVVRQRNAEELWRWLAAAMPPFAAWLESLEPAAVERARAVYAEEFPDGELRRPYLLVAGRRR